MASKDTGARFEIAVDGKPRSYRSDAVTAREGAIFLKIKSPHAEVIVRDVVTGETIPEPGLETVRDCLRRVSRMSLRPREQAARTKRKQH
jgi:hypothetical protein